MEIISVDKRIFDMFAARVEDIELKVERMCRRQEDLGLNDWLDNQEVCEILGISKRTLQSYRENGLLPYSRTEHKIRYSPADVERLLKESAHNQPLK